MNNNSSYADALRDTDRDPAMDAACLSQNSDLVPTGGGSSIPAGWELVNGKMVFPLKQPPKDTEHFNKRGQRLRGPADERCALPKHSRRGLKHTNGKCHDQNPPLPEDEPQQVGGAVRRDAEMMEALAQRFMRGQELRPHGGPLALDQYSTAVNSVFRHRPIVVRSPWVVPAGVTRDLAQHDHNNDIHPLDPQTRFGDDELLQFPKADTITRPPRGTARCVPTDEHIAPGPHGLAHEKGCKDVLKPMSELGYELSTDTTRIQGVMVPFWRNTAEPLQRIEAVMHTLSEELDKLALHLQDDEVSSAAANYDTMEWKNQMGYGLRDRVVPGLHGLADRVRYEILQQPRAEGHIS